EVSSTTKVPKGAARGFTQLRRADGFSETPKVVRTSPGIAIAHAQNVLCSRTAVGPHTANPSNNLSPRRDTFAWTLRTGGYLAEAISYSLVLNLTVFSQRSKGTTSTAVLEILGRRLNN